VTGYCCSDGRSSISDRDGDFSLYHQVQTGFGTHQAPWGSFFGGKTPEAWNGPLFPPTGEGYNALRYTCIPLYAFMATFFISFAFIQYIVRNHFSNFCTDSVSEYKNNHRIFESVSFITTVQIFLLQTLRSQFSLNIEWYTELMIRNNAWTCSQGLRHEWITFFYTVSCVGCTSGPSGVSIILHPLLHNSLPLLIPPSCFIFLSCDLFLCIILMKIHQSDGPCTWVRFPAWAWNLSLHHCLEKSSGRACNYVLKFQWVVVLCVSGNGPSWKVFDKLP